MTNESMKYAEAIAGNIEELMCGNVPSCHDESEPMDVIEWLEDALDIEVRTGLDGEYRSTRVMVTCGGPNAFIDTRSELVQVYWWNEYGEWSIDSGFCAELDACIEELYACR